MLDSEDYTHDQAIVVYNTESKEVTFNTRPPKVGEGQ